MRRMVGLAFAAVRPVLVFVFRLALPLAAGAQGTPTGAVAS